MVYFNLSEVRPYSFRVYYYISLEFRFNFFSFFHNFSSTNQSIIPKLWAVYLSNDRMETTKSLCLDSQPSLSVCIAYLYWLETFFYYYFHFILYICSIFPLHYLHKLSTFWRLVFLYQISITTIYSKVINMSLSEKALPWIPKCIIDLPIDGCYGVTH